MEKNRFYAICILLFFCLNPIKGQVIFNGDFEEAEINPENSFIELFIGNTSINNWTVETGSIDYIGSLWKASEGTHSIDLNGLQSGTIAQSFNTRINQIYCVNFDLAGNPFGARTLKILNVSIANFTLDYTFDVSDYSSQNMGWKTRSFEFTAIDTISSIRFSSLVPRNAGPAIDNVQLLECYDCLNVLNGTAVIDDCGICLEPTDPNFSISCIEENQIYIPNAFSPNDDGINDRFLVFSREGLETRIVELKIFNRWGALVFESKDVDLNSIMNGWNGESKGEKLDSGVYVYLIQIKFPNGKIKQFEGDITIFR